MGRQPEPYRLKKRGKYWHYKLPNESVFHTTGKTNRAKAAVWVERYRTVERPGVWIYFSDYASQYYTEDCPWWTRENARRMDSRPISVKTRDGYSSYLRNHILPRFGHVLIFDLTAAAFRKWLYDLDYSSQTKKHIWRALIIILEDMVADGLIFFNPRGEIKAPIVRHEEKQIPRPDEIDALFPSDIASLKSLWNKGWRSGVMMALCYSCGLRTQEARALDIRAVDWERKALRVIWAISSDEGFELAKADSMRVVLIPERTFTLLDAVRGSRDEGLLFLGVDGEQRAAKSPGQALQRVIKKLKAADKIKESRHFTPHALRHAYNTKMREILRDAAMAQEWDDKRMQFNVSDLSDKILRAFTGHKSQKMTRQYNHPDMELAIEFYDKNFREHIEKIWR